MAPSASYAAQSTCAPTPEARARSTPARAPRAAVCPIEHERRDPRRLHGHVERSGPGGTCTDAASWATRSDHGSRRRDPSVPKPLMVVDHERRELRRARRRGTCRTAARSPSPALSITMSAAPRSSRTVRAPASSVGDDQRCACWCSGGRTRSGCCRSGSPSGGSTLTTSAPRSAKTLPQYDARGLGRELEHGDVAQQLSHGGQMLRR